MKFSKYYHEEEIREGIYAIYNALTMNTLFVSKTELEKIQNMDFSDEEYKILIKNGIIVENEIIDEEVWNRYKTQIEENIGKIESVFIVLTNKCNLRCKYCGVKNMADEMNAPVDEDMSYAVIDQFINQYSRYIKKHNIKSPVIVFYGGEPTLCTDKIVYIVEKLSAIQSFRFTMVTNGTLVGTELINLCLKYNISLGISIDGPKEINDENRVFSSRENKSVYDEVLIGLKQLKEKNVQCNLSVTITEYMLDHKEEFFDWIKEIFESYGVDKISYNLLRFQNSNFDSVSYNNKATEFLIESYRRTGNIIYEDRLGRKLRSFIEGKFFYADCTAITGNQIVLKPNGDITICQIFCQGNKDIVGNIRDISLEEIDKSYIKRKFLSLLPITSEKCQKCEALGTCGGGCYWEAQKHDEKLDIGFCMHSKKVQKWLLEELYKLSIGEMDT